MKISIIRPGVVRPKDLLLSAAAKDKKKEEEKFFKHVCLIVVFKLIKRFKK